MTTENPTCPRCRRNCLDKDPAMNSVSHQDHKVSICSICGQMEGLVKLGASVPKSEIALTSEFEDWLKKRKSK